jgi:hypothetical protein
MSKSRNWSLTSFDLEKKFDHQDIKYVKWQLEEAPSTRRRHLQCYVQMKESKKLSWMKSQIDPAGHWEIMKGTQEQMIAYVSKDTTRIAGPWSQGEINQQGKRTDMEKIVQIAKDGGSIRQMLDEVPGSTLRYLGNAEKVIEIYREHRTGPPEITWIWGPPGTGKTSSVIALFGEDNVFIKDNTKWWPNYKQQECILQDEIDLAQWDRNDLLRLWDRYQYEGQTKGGYVKINSPFIYITSEAEPFGLDAAQRRRIKRIVHVDVILAEREDRERMQIVSEEAPTQIIEEKYDVIDLTD